MAMADRDKIGARDASEIIGESPSHRGTLNEHDAEWRYAACPLQTFAEARAADLRRRYATCATSPAGEL